MLSLILLYGGARFSIGWWFDNTTDFIINSYQEVTCIKKWREGMKKQLINALFAFITICGWLDCGGNKEVTKSFPCLLRKKHCQQNSTLTFKQKKLEKCFYLKKQYDLNRVKEDETIYAYLLKYIDGMYSGTRPVPLQSLYQNSTKELRFVFIIPSYNNADWYEKNLSSIFSQKYSNFHIIYVDDASSDGTASLVESFARKNGFLDKITLIKNDKRKGMAYNRFIATNLCNSTDICLAVDGDDFLAHDKVLSFYNKVYQDRNVWLTYGQFVDSPSGKVGFCQQVPQSIINKNLFRRMAGAVHKTHKGFKTHRACSHLKTYYAWLFHLIDPMHFKMQGRYFSAATDVAMMIPMLEMAGNYSRFINEITYIYNRENIRSLYRNKDMVDQTAQSRRFIQKLPKYKPIKIGLKDAGKGND